MNARPILFSSPMVKALLAGTKTQTRRAIKAPTRSGSYLLSFNHGVPEFNFGLHDIKPNGDLRWHRCPYGQPSDLLWVRETHRDARSADLARVLFKADGDACCGWQPSIHMPRSISRLTLRITDVRVQRLQDINEEDALAEGIDVGAMNAANCAAFRAGTHSRLLAFEYLRVWESINGPGSWKANPWVWALTFEVIKANVAEVKP